MERSHGRALGLSIPRNRRTRFRLRDDSIHKSDNMLGILVVFALSWVILWLVNKEHITVLGLIPNQQRLKEFSLGLLSMASLCALNLLGQAYFKEISYVPNTDYGGWEALTAVGWTLRAAAFEEFVFRGALLYLAIRKLGTKKACLIAAIAFGIYHWFSYEMFGGRIIAMIYIFLLTGASGWAFALAFAKTKSLYAPLGLHFGWILVSIVVFSEGPLGNQLLVADDPGIEMGGWPTLIFFVWQAVAVPGIVTWYLLRRYR